MRSKSHVRRALLTALLLGACVVVLTGCAKENKQPAAQPKVKPPAVADAGVLRAGVDLDYPPFGGVDKGKQAGIDVDVARALAAKLGLQLKIVSIPATEALSALAAGTVDAAFSVPISASTVASASVVGSYISDGPAFFGTADETMTVAGLRGRIVAAQKGSQAFWSLENTLGQGAVHDFDTLRAAFGGLEDGKVDVVAGDALVGAYIARDFPNVRYVGQLGAARLLTVAVAKDNSQLADALRESLDGLASDGVLKTVRSKWVGDLPELAVAN